MAGEETVFCRRQPGQRIHNFVVLWLDASIDESTPEFKESLGQLHESVGTTIEIFKDANECIQEIQETMNQKVLFIVSGYVGQNIVPTIHGLPQVESIYVLCRNKDVHEQWANKMSKVKAICTDIKSICEGLKHDREQCDQNMIPMSFQSGDPLFMYTQLVKEAILQIDYDDVESIKEFAQFCRKKGNILVNETENFENTYAKEEAIWWYTAPYSLYSVLNYALRVFDVDILMKMGFFLSHLHRQIQELSEKQQADPKDLKIMGRKQFELYRGQGLLTENFDKLKQSKGGLMSFNNFLSASYSKDISLGFAKQSASDEDIVGILFIIQIDTDLCKKFNVPFVEITGKIGFYEDVEAEILFTTHTLFKIENVQKISDSHTDWLYEVNLTVASPDTHELKELADSLDQEIGYRRGLARFAYILLKSGLPEQARHIYYTLLGKATTEDDIAECNQQLGWVHYNLDEHKKAIQYYELDLEYKKKTLPPNDLGFSASYNNIGTLYDNMGEYSKALESYKQSTEIQKQVLPSNHPDLAASYNNIGMVHHTIGDYSKALSWHQQSLQLHKQVLPSNHPDCAQSHNNIGLVYNKMGDYSKSLSSYQRSLEIQKQVLPSNHPGLAASYNNIGLVCGDMGDYSKALSWYQQSLELRKQVLPSNHPDLAASYNNIGLVYSSMDDYSKALSSFEQSLEIQKQVLPPNHPDLASSYGNMGLLYEELNNYAKACEHHAAYNDIFKISLPPGHPNMAKAGKNLDRARSKMLDNVFH